jgi:hypothetical protein
MRGLVGLAGAVLAFAVPAAAEKLVWKPVVAAVLKVDEKPVKYWEVYQAEKRPHLILVQLGQRFLMLDAKAREVYEISPEQLARKKKQLEGEHPGSLVAEPPQEEKGAARKPPAQVLASEDWATRNAGRAWVVRMRLAAEGRVLEVQLPQVPDFRSLY